MDTINKRVQYIVDKEYSGNYTKFARAMEVSPVTIFNIISGRKSEPSFGILQKMVASHPDINPMWIMDGQGDMYAAKDEPDDIAREAPPDYGYDPAKMLSVFMSQQDTIASLTKQLEKQTELVAEKQAIINDLSGRLKLKDADLRFSERQSKKHNPNSAVGEIEGRQAV